MYRCRARYPDIDRASTLAVQVSPDSSKHYIRFLDMNTVVGAFYNNELCLRYP